MAEEHAYFAMEEEFLCMQSELKREEQELEFMQMEFSFRHETDANILESLRREIDDQKNILQDKKEQNINLISEHNSQKG